ncbi:sensor histidine kinase [Paramaledivibacter caminithermalis]|jgi:PAS domain S-box-containing protein|uniref:histidine kinase n=1 Tax=Paramaledivibacter caminithermalis (strain DSM 15212 / CIP 107654 / DViRD3) TaxID=1121301 RepID=A0A1M6LJY3_PARC5|nr:ATP-binding protein [Paramaledivibacter caminithermalis]SHJ71491.1 PAS domain S-box-containing protein [Paramaledivibacter caminithermalis DSM 15212]
MKWDIENKILIPFMILVILPILIIGIVSYWNGYQLLLNDKIKNIEDNLNEHILFINTINEEVEKNNISIELGKEKAISYFNGLNKNGMIIFEDDEVILNNLNEDSEFIRNIMNNIIKSKNNIYKNDDIFFTYRNFDKWQWKIGYGLYKDIFTDELVEIQKHILLIAIIFLVFSMQATILISHNISKPIKMLAETCCKIGMGNLKEKISINREDEIGILAEAFNNMVSKLEKNTKELVKVKKFNEDILRSISIGIITADKDGNILSINKTGERILERNKSSESLKEALMDQLIETLENEKSKNEVLVLNKMDDRNRRYWDVTTSLLRTEDNKTNGAICTFNDITRRKTIEQNIERINRLTSTGELAAGLAHEIRNPLAGMKMSIQVLKGRLCKETNESNLNLFNSVLYEIDRLNNLITQLLDFAKPHVSKYDKTNILEILNKSLDLTKKELKEKDIKTNIHIETDELSVFIDKAQIEQVFINIIKNSINAMKKQGKLHIKLENSIREKIEFLSITFEDNGCGIKEEYLEKIFNPFFTTHSQGTGLGLSVVHKLVVENKGEIEVDSIVGKGTKFIIRFPLYGGEIDEKKNINN